MPYYGIDVQKIQNKISARVGYETKIYDNPIKQLKAIREHAMDYQETKYEMSQKNKEKEKILQNILVDSKQQKMCWSHILEVH